MAVPRKPVAPVTMTLSELPKPERWKVIGVIRGVFRKEGGNLASSSRMSPLQGLNSIWKVTHGSAVLKRRKGYRITDMYTYIHLQFPLSACCRPLVAGGTSARLVCGYTEIHARQALDFD